MSVTGTLISRAFVLSSVSAAAGLIAGKYMVRAVNSATAAVPARRVTLVSAIQLMRFVPRLIRWYRLRLARG